MKRWSFDTKEHAITNEKGEIVAYLDIQRDDFIKDIQFLVCSANVSMQIMFDDLKSEENKDGD